MSGEYSTRVPVATRRVVGCSCLTVVPASRSRSFQSASPAVIRPATRRRLRDICPSLFPFVLQTGWPTPPETPRKPGLGWDGMGWNGWWPSGGSAEVGGEEVGVGLPAHDQP